MAPKKDLCGLKFGKITVLSDSGRRNKNGGILWICECECGAITDVRGDGLQSGAVVSCGCHKAEMAAKMFTKHGMYATAMYSRWQNMRERCHNPKNPGFKDYGGRGIFVCRLWRKSFVKFQKWAEVAGFVEELDIDRTNNNGPYAPWNCRYVTRSINNLNKRSSGVYAHKNGRFYSHLKFHGKRKSFGGFATYDEAKTIRESHRIEVIYG